MERDSTADFVRRIVLVCTGSAFFFSLIESYFHFVVFPWSSVPNAAFHLVLYSIAFLLAGLGISLLVAAVSRMFLASSGLESSERWAIVLFGAGLPIAMISLYISFFYSLQRVELQTRLIFISATGLAFLFLMLILHAWGRKKTLEGQAISTVSFLAACFWFYNATLFILKDPARLVSADLRDIPVIPLLLSIAILIYFFVRQFLKICVRVSGGRVFKTLVALFAAFVVVSALTLLLPFDPKFEPVRDGDAPPNLVLIVLDTARPDQFSLYGYERTTTPFLDSLAVESVVFQDAITPAPWTLPAHASLFTGRYPSAHGADWDNLQLGSDQATLAEFLASRNYQTFGLSNNAWLRRENGMAQGFSTYLEMWRKKFICPTLKDLVIWTVMKSSNTSDGGAMKTNQTIFDWFRNSYDARRPFFLFVNYMELHLASSGPENYWKHFTTGNVSGKIEDLIGRDLYPLVAGKLELTDDEYDVLRDLYDGNLLYLDRRVGELVRFMDRGKLMDNTILIVTSDHGENIGEHGMIDHQFNIYDTLIKVPLLIRLPEGTTGVLSGIDQIQLVDIAPTLLEILGFKTESSDPPFQGQSIVRGEETGEKRSFSVIEYKPPSSMIRAFSENNPTTDISLYDRSIWSIRTDSLKYIGYSDGFAELYDIRVDPFEETNLIEEKRQKAEEMGALLQQWLLSVSRKKEVETLGEIDEETLKVLRSLGYVN